MNADHKEARKHAVCIQCHNKPEIVNYLISCLPEELFDVYIHVDRKSDIYDRIIKKKNVRFSKRIDVRWGRFSQVEASLNMFMMFVPMEYSYIHLISGNDFMIKSPQYIFDSLNGEEEYIESNELGEGKNTWSWGGGRQIFCLLSTVVNSKASK